MCVASNYLKQKNEGVSLTKQATIKQLLQSQYYSDLVFFYLFNL